jgi:hypothetical protein
MIDQKTSDFKKIADKATFILGHARSGTSLLLALLDGHPELVVFPGELKFFKRVGNPTADNFLLRTDFHVCFDKNRFAIKGIDYSSVRGSLQRRLNDAHHKRDMLRSIIHTYAEIEPSRSNKKKRWVEKTPHNIKFMPTLESWFPETAKYIYIVRDPRDVFASSRKRPEYGLQKFCVDWAINVMFADVCKKKLGERFLIIRYEDIISNLKGTLKKLAAFLEIELCGTLQTPTKNGIPWMGNSRFIQERKGIDNQSISKYPQRLKPFEIKKIEMELHTKMRQYGYDAQIHQNLKQRIFISKLGVLLRYLLFLVEWRFPVLQSRLMQ